jgi:hypothetical protein
MIKIYVISNDYNFDKLTQLLKGCTHYTFYTQLFKHLDLIKQGKLLQTDGTLKDATKNEIINFKRIIQKNIHQKYEILTKDNMLEFLDSFDQVFDRDNIILTFNYIGGFHYTAENILFNLKGFIKNIPDIKFNFIEYLKLVTGFINSIKIRIILDDKIINLNVDDDFSINEGDFNQKTDILFIKRDIQTVPFLSKGGLL